MQLDLLNAFVAIAEAGSLAKAAQRSGIPTSTLSRNLAALEKSLGLRLMQRSTRALSLTADGQQLYQRVTPQLSLLQEALEDSRSASQEPSGLLRLTAPSSLGRIVVAPLIAEFLLRYPKVQVEALFSDRRINLIGEGIDLAFRMGALADSAMIARTLGMAENVLCASPAYLERHGTPQAPQELEQHRLMSYSRESQALELKHADGRQLQLALAYDLLCSPPDALLASLLAGVGIAWLPGFVVSQDLQQGRLQQVLPEWRLSAGEIHMLYPSARGMPRKLSAFMELVSLSMAQDGRFQKRR